MYTSLDVFKMAHAMATHAGQRQALVSQNVAHADTPGFRARDLPPFSESYNAPSAAAALRASRPGHLFGQSGTLTATPVDRGGAPAANGNTVTIEDQMLQAVEVRRQHDRALAIYRSAMGILRSSLGRQA